MRRPGGGGKRLADKDPTPLADLEQLFEDDTAQFAVASIRGWWQALGSERYPSATSLTITADCGGSNGHRTRPWKTELQRLADDSGLQICVCHFPPGLSMWNQIEHRLFSFFTQNWRGKPL